MSGGSGPGGVFKAGDTLTASWDNSSGGDANLDLAGAEFDFGPFGGGVVAATASGSSWTASYTIPTGSLDVTSKNVSLTATDDAGNSTITADTTNATLDNQLPVVTDAKLSIGGATGTGGTFRVGDTVTSTWNNTSGGDNNSDIATVTVNFSQFGGPAAVAATGSSGTWTATYIIASGYVEGTNSNVSVTATDDAGNSTTTADTSNQPFGVTQVSATKSGFVAYFGQELDVSSLNLYDQGGVLGPADVTLVGTSGEAVLGSLVVDPGLRQVRFIKTGGVLLPDTYTATLVSGATAFKDTFGHFLDGDGNGTGGDDFVTSFVVGSPAVGTVTVGVEDFVRGFGQSVNLPAITSAGIPITLSTGQNIGGANVTLTYNPALLSITGGSSPIPGASASIDTSTPGVVHILVTKGSEFSSSAGLITLVNLTATVPNGAPYNSKEVLDLTVHSIVDVSGGAMPSVDDDGLHIAAYRGDVNGNQDVNTGDVTLALRLQSGVLSTSGFASLPLADPYFVSDMNDNGTASTGDVTGLMRFLSGASGGFPRIPDLPTGFSPPPGGQDPQIFIPTTGLSGAVGNVITVPVKLNVTESGGIGLAGIRVDFGYDSSHFTISNVRFGDALDNHSFSSSFNTATAGIARLVAAVDVGPSFQNGYVGDLFLFDLTVKAGAATGSSAINLLASTAASNNDTDNLLIAPAISNGADVNDGVITVVEPGFIITPLSGLVTTEAGATASFTVKLNSQPTADVTLGLLSSNTAEGTVSPASLTFTTANWSTAQTVTVTGVDDFVDDGDIAYTIVTAPASSLDGNYDGLNPANVAVTNNDDDTAGFTITPVSGLTTTEAGGTASFTVKLNSRPTADVTLGLSSSNTAEGTVSPASLTFTSANWSTAQTVTVTGVDDFVDDGDIAYTIVTAPASSLDGNYDGLNPANVTVTNNDDDTAGFTITPVSGLTTTEAGGTASFTVKLNSRPTADVTLGLSSSNTAEGTVSPASLTFTTANWSTAQTVTVTGVDDFVDDGDIAYTIVTAPASSLDGNYGGLNPANVTVTNNDDDTAGFTITPVSGLTTTEAGGTASFTVKLNSQPTADVTLGLSSSNTAEGTVSPASLTFTTANWSTAQTVTVTGVDDFVDDGDIAYTIVTAPASSLDGNYDGLNPANVTVTNLDNDPLVVHIVDPDFDRIRHPFQSVL